MASPNEAVSRSLSSLPPEVISEVLSFLPPDDLLSCALLSTDFAALSTHPTLWARHALEAWDPERRLPSENYHAYFIRRKRRDGSASTLVEEMGKAATGNLGRLEGIRELGADVMEAVKRETAVRETDDSENWLSRRYWARQAYEMLVRAKAVEWWKTILAMDVEGETSFEEGVSCFAAYRGVDPSQVLSYFEAATLVSPAPGEIPPSLPRQTLLGCIKFVCTLMQALNFKPASGRSFHHIENHFLDFVWAQSSLADQSENHGSLPLSLVTVFCAFIRRLPASYNIQARPVGFPGVVLAAVAVRDAEPGKEEWIYVNVFAGGQVLDERMLRAMLLSTGAAMEPQYIRPATAKEMCLRVARNIVNSVREDDAHGAGDHESTTAALYAAAMALFLFTPPDATAAYADWLVSICQAEFPADVGVLERDVAPGLEEERRDEVLEMCKSIREGDEELPEPRRRVPIIKWRVGHIFRHRLFGYVAVVRGWDLTCEASEQWIMQMQVDRLAYGRHQPFYHVIVEDGSTRYVASENITLNRSVGDADVERLLAHRSIGKYFRTAEREDGRWRFLKGARLSAAYPED